MNVSTRRLAWARRTLRPLYPAAYLLHLPAETVIALADMVHAPLPASAASPAPVPVRPL